MLGLQETCVLHIPNMVLPTVVRTECMVMDATLVSTITTLVLCVHDDMKNMLDVLVDCWYAAELSEMSLRPSEGEPLYVHFAQDFF